MGMFPSSIEINTMPTPKKAVATDVIERFNDKRAIATTPTVGTLWTSTVRLLCRTVNMADNAVDLADRTVAYANMTNEQWIDTALATREAERLKALDAL